MLSVSALNNSFDQCRVQNRQSFKGIKTNNNKLSGLQADTVSFGMSPDYGEFYSCAKPPSKLSVALMAMCFGWMCIDSMVSTTHELEPLEPESNVECTVDSQQATANKASDQVAMPYKTESGAVIYVPGVDNIINMEHNNLTVENELDIFGHIQGRYEIIKNHTLSHAYFHNTVEVSEVDLTNSTQDQFQIDVSSDAVIKVGEGKVVKDLLITENNGTVLVKSGGKIDNLYIEGANIKVVVEEGASIGKIATSGQYYQNTMSIDSSSASRIGSLPGAVTG